jgi:OOP family OmpA-OmpF porin
MPLSRFPFRRTLFALAVAALFAPTLQAADKGRWINDGFGRSTRDGQGSTCVASGGDTHAFANPDCEAGEAAKRASAPRAAAPAPSGSADGKTPGGAAAAAPPVIMVEDPKAAAPAASGTGGATGVPAAATIRDTTGAPVRDGLARKCVLDARGIGLSGADCDASGAVAEPMAAPAPAASATADAPATQAPATAAAPATDVPSGGAATGAAAAAAAAGAGAAVAALADNDDDTPPAEDDADDALVEEDDTAIDDTEEDTPWLADGDGPDALADAGDAGAAPAYAGESLGGESAAAEPPPSAATLRESDTVPIAAAAAPAVATESAPPAAPAVQPPLKKVLQVEKSALFDTNSAVLKQKSVPELDELAALLRDAPGYGAVTVVGHTDRLGSDKLNQRLSERRAKAVRDYLVTRGVDPSRITAEGRGRLQPVTAPGACDRLKRKALRACLAPDRRVEIEAQDIQVPATPAK